MSMTHASCPEEIQTIQKEQEESKAAKAKAAKEKENQKGSKSTKGILHHFFVFHRNTCFGSCNQINDCSVSCVHRKDR